MSGDSAPHRSLSAVDAHQTDAMLNRSRSGAVHLMRINLKTADSCLNTLPQP